MAKKIIKLNICCNNREPCGFCFDTGQGVMFCTMRKTRCCYDGGKTKLQIKHKNKKKG